MLNSLNADEKWSYELRLEMFEKNKDTCCAVFIGGMNGIIDEAEKVSSLFPGVKLLPIASTGCASATVYKNLGTHDADMESNIVYLKAFRKLLEPYKHI